MKGMKTLLKYMFFFIMTFIFFSCSSMNNSFFEKSGASVADQINDGMTRTLVEESLYPFAFESEILVSENQVQLLWEGLIGGEYKILSPRTVMNRPAVPADYQLFSESWEMRTFFEKYLKEDDRLVKVEGTDSSLYFLIRRNDKDFSLLGMKEEGK